MMTADLHTKAADCFGANPTLHPPAEGRAYPFVAFALATTTDKHGGCTGCVDVFIYDPAILDKIAAGAAKGAALLRAALAPPPANENHDKAQGTNQGAAEEPADFFDPSPAGP